MLTKLSVRGFAIAKLLLVLIVLAAICQARSVPTNRRVHQPDVDYNDLDGQMSISGEADRADQQADLEESLNALVNAQRKWFVNKPIIPAGSGKA